MCVQPGHLGCQWSGLVQASDDTVSLWDTGMPADILKFVGVKSVEVPADFVSCTGQGMNVFVREVGLQDRV